MAAFVTLLTEIMPAGLLSEIAAGMDITESASGQFITAFAVGALLSALPMTLFTRSVCRKRLVLSGLGGFACVNLLTALSQDFYLSLMIRFLAGVLGGMIWAMFAGYAVRLAPAGQEGRAIALAGSGVTIALVLGAPLSAFLERFLGWRGAFALVAVFSTALFVWSALILPACAGIKAARSVPLRGVLQLSGVLACLGLIFSFVSAHSLLYIYIEPLLILSGLADHLDLMLLFFGAGSVGGLVLVGIFVDRYLCSVACLDIALFVIGACLLCTAPFQPVVVCMALGFWGIAFGGFAPLTQSMSARVSGSSMDAAQALCTTAWNGAVSAGGFGGGLLLAHLGARSFAWAAALLGLLAFFTFYRGIRPRLVRPCSGV